MHLRALMGADSPEAAGHAPYLNALERPAWLRVYEAPVARLGTTASGIERTILISQEVGESPQSL
jgi:hypothetical protein